MVCATIDWVMTELADQVDDPIHLVDGDPDAGGLGRRGSLDRARLLRHGLREVPRTGGGHGGLRIRLAPHRQALDRHGVPIAHEVEALFDLGLGPRAQEPDGPAEVALLRVHLLERREASQIGLHLDQLSQLGEPADEVHRVEAPPEDVARGPEADLEERLGRRGGRGLPGALGQHLDLLAAQDRAERLVHPLGGLLFLGRGGAGVALGPAHERVQHVTGGEQRVHRLRGHGQTALAKLVQQILERVGEVGDLIQPEHGAIALEGVRAPEDPVQQLGIARILLQRQQSRLEVGQQLGRFLEEGLQQRVCAQRIPPIISRRPSLARHRRTHGGP